jgi:hypothetical protein
VIRISRIATALAVVAAGTLVTAGPALAQSAPATSNALFCPVELQNGQLVREPDGSVLFCVEADGAGAIVARTVVARTGVFLDHVIVAPGWDWTFGGGGGARHGQGAINDKVDVRFQSTTGDKVEVRMEAGKTEVKG